MPEHKPRLDNGINPRMLYDESEVADLLCVTIRTVANYRLTGRLLATQVNRRKYLYSGEAIRRLLTPIEAHHYDA
ncbi:DNA-binding protein [Leptospira santarosai]|uniref:DNA-binding protein n=1 Tax=Leptospira santarosai TaxID=28183 RepID=UPI0026E292E3|nr:DNA-binding protein [Leptospira santarosai]MDO6395464.1 DNA-binding protein [Leptospira santarosai]